VEITKKSVYSITGVTKKQMFLLLCACECGMENGKLPEDEQIAHRELAEIFDKGGE